MNSYETPKVIENQDVSEGVYMASGAGDGTADNSDGGAKCDSKYMNGVWLPPDYSDWGGSTRGYKQQFGCLGCPANTGSGCGLETHYIQSGNAQSYDVDDGSRKPSWEKKNYGPDDPATDWVM